MRIFADVHRKKDDSGYRITYTTDGEVFKHVDSPIELPVEAGDRLYVDVIPVAHTDAFIQLLRRGVEVFYLRRLNMIETIRQGLGIPKSNKGDVRVLMSIDEHWFKRTDEDFLAMRQLISDYRRLERDKQRLENQSKDAFNKDSFKRLIDHIEEEQKTVAIPIIEEAEKRLPLFRIIAEELGITGDNHVLAREALAEVLMYIDPRWSWRKTVNFFGLFKSNNKKKKKIYNGKARRALERLTIAVYNISPEELTAKLQKKLLRHIWLTVRREAQERLAGIPAQQQG
jgi:hypothetical protein